MSYEERDNGAHAVMCDTPGCKRELIAPSREDVFSDVSLAGWVRTGEDDKQTELHACGYCTRGRHPATGMIHQMLGGDTFTTKAPYNVQAGDEFKDPNGDVLGKYQAAVGQGDEVEVKVELPAPKKPTQSRRARFKDMLEGTGDYQGIRSAVAPSNLQVTPSEDRVATPAIQVPHTPQVDHAALAAAEAAFGELDTTWDPDEDDDI